MFKIKTLNQISQTGLNEFDPNLYKIDVQIDQPEAILVRSSDMHDMVLPESVLVVGRAGAGTNNIPVDKLTTLGVPVLNTPGANANAVKELVIAGMLLACRNICAAWNFAQQLQGDSDEVIHEQVEKNKKQFSGTELPGKTLGVIGLGHVGVKVANAAGDLGMQVIGFDPAITVRNAWELSATVQQAENIEEIVRKADFLTFHVPLTDKTRHLINAKYLQMMKTGVVLLNFARDGIIENNDLMEALREKKVKYYVSDFPNLIFHNHPQVIALPHLGASTLEAEENCAVMIAQQVREYLEQGHIKNSVNFPNIAMPRNNGDHRLAVINANVPNMVAQISTALSSAQVNILDMINKSRGDIAYTLLDTSSPINDEILKKINQIVGVVRARCIPANPT